MTREGTLDQGVELRPAGFVTRLVAFLVDQLIIIVILSLLSAVVAILVQSFRLSNLLGTGDLTLQLTTIALGATGTLLDLAYFAGFWTLAGQTPGKALLGLAVVRTDGSPLHGRTAIVRWLGYLLSSILFLGFLWVLVDNRRQGWHDKLARTLVIYRSPDEGWSTPPGEVEARSPDVQETNGADTAN